MSGKIFTRQTKYKKSVRTGLTSDKLQKRNVTKTKERHFSDLMNNSSRRHNNLKCVCS